MYDPYGNVTVLTPSWGSRASTLYAWVYLHQGGRYENVSALYHFRYRDYSPTLGRWVQRDPIQYVAGDANLYRHEANRPINMLDPTGLESITYRLFHAPLVGRSQWAFSVTLTADFDPKTGRVIGNPTLSDPVGLTTMTQKGLAAKLNLHKVGDVKTGWSQEAEFALITSDPKVEVVKGTVPGLGGVKLPCELVVATLDFTLIKKGTFDVSVLSVEGGVVSLGYKEQQKGTVLKGRIHLGLGPAYWHYGYADYGFDARGITAWEQAPRDATARRLPETKVAKTPFTEAYEVIWRK
ncbi:MAG TPA: RHS repeat-associated core domain-containing protein [Gemmataceae bacterium]|nr:RHS repeat-associated core domain-containing protein [Gemmataceae bacterium]